MTSGVNAAFQPGRAGGPAPEIDLLTPIRAAPYGAAMPFAPMTPEGARVAPLIDHTLLKADAVGSQVASLCAEARHYGFATVCVHPYMIRFVAAELDGSAVKPCTVVGFPLGASTTDTKAFEADDAVRKGAEELDMVIAISALKDGEYDYVLNDIQSVVRAAGDVTVKVIFETCLLTDAEKLVACRLCLDAGARFVKTSTGLAGGGATVEDIRLMRKAVGRRCEVKAAGGIRTLADALRMIDAGATRLGTSAGVAIVT